MAGVERVVLREVEAQGVVLVVAMEVAMVEATVAVAMVDLVGAG